MSSKFVKSILFLIILCFFYILSAVFYGRDLSDFIEVGIYYLIVFIFIPLSLLFFVGVNTQYYSSTEIVYLLSKANISFLPENLIFGDNNSVIIYFLIYVVYYVIPLGYFYLFYFLSNRLYIF